MSAEATATATQPALVPAPQKHFQGLLYLKIYGAVDVPVDADESKFSWKQRIEI